MTEEPEFPEEPDEPDGELLLVVVVVVLDVVPSWLVVVPSWFVVVVVCGFDLLSLFAPGPPGLVLLSQPTARKSDAANSVKAARFMRKTSRSGDRVG